MKKLSSFLPSTLLTSSRCSFGRACFLLFFLSACIPLTEPTADLDIPTLAVINAPLIESPALVSIRFINELDGWGVTETQIARTNDGGITWYNVTPPALTEAGYSIETFVLDNDHVWIQLPDLDNFPNSGFLYRTTDGGITWTSYKVPFSRARLSFLIANADNGWAMSDLGAGAGSMGVSIFQTIDGGATWNQTYTNDPNLANAGDSLPLGGLKSDITDLNMHTAWVGGVTYATSEVYLYRTDDKGASWNQIALPLPPGAENAELSVESIQFVSYTNAFLTLRMTSDKSNLAVYVSSDSGDTWSLTPTLIPDGGSADFLSAEEAVIYNGQQFYVTRDAARTWSIIPPDILFGDTFAGMDFVDTSTGWVVTVDPTNHRSLYRTSDGGATWFPLTP